MIALQISLNDVPLCVAGAADLAVLNSIVNAVGVLGPGTKSLRAGQAEDPDLFLTVGGLTSRHEGDDEHLRWVENTQLAVGDCIKITVMETDAVDLPVSRIEKRPENKPAHPTAGNAPV
jgi:hypothetical protein